MTRARDETWNAIASAAERINENYFDAIFGRGGEFELHAHRRRSFRQWEVVDGFILVGLGVGPGGREYPVVFEPVRARSMLSSSWREVQPLSEADRTPVIGPPAM
jgi:hypothetical protein